MPGGKWVASGPPSPLCTTMDPLCTTMDSILFCFFQHSKRTIITCDISDEETSTSLSTDVEIWTRKVISHSPEKASTSRSKREVVSYDKETAELISTFPDFNPRLILDDLYEYPYQTSFDLPPRPQPKSTSSYSDSGSKSDGTKADCDLDLISIDDAESDQESKSSEQESHCDKRPKSISGCLTPENKSNSDCQEKEISKSEYVERIRKKSGNSSSVDQPVSIPLKRTFKEEIQAIFEYESPSSGETKLSDEDMDIICLD